MGPGDSCGSRCPHFCSGPGPCPASGLGPKGHSSKRRQKRSLLHRGGPEGALGQLGPTGCPPLSQLSDLTFLKHFFLLPLIPSLLVAFLLHFQRFPSTRNTHLHVLFSLSISSGVLSNTNVPVLPGRAPRKRRPCGWTQSLRREAKSKAGRARISFLDPWFKTTLDAASFS